MWPDESTFWFNNWAEGQPGTDGNENCLRVHGDGYWHDYPCDTTNSYYPCVKTANYMK